MASVRKLKKDDPSSPWIVEYTDPSTGRRRRATPKSGLKKDAEALRRKIEGEIDGGIHVAPSTSPTLADLGDAFMAQTEARLSDGRIGRSRHKIIRYTVETCLKPFLGAIKLCDLRRTDVENWYNWLRSEKKLAPQTAKVRVVILQTIEDFAIRRQWTKVTPVRDYMRDLNGIRQPRVRTFSAEQAGALLRTASVRAPLMKKRAHVYTECAVNLAACCGLRYGEIMGLTLDDVQFDARRLAVRHNLTSWDELKGPKTTAGVRNVPLPQHVALMLGIWIAQHYVSNERRLLFRTCSGKQIMAPSFHKNAWIPLLARAGLGARHRRGAPAASPTAPGAVHAERSGGQRARSYRFHRERRRPRRRPGRGPQRGARLRPRGPRSLRAGWPVRDGRRLHRARGGARRRPQGTARRPRVGRCRPGRDHLDAARRRRGAGGRRTPRRQQDHAVQHGT